MDGIAGALIADAEYPQRVAFSLLSNLCNEFMAKYAGQWTTVTAENSIQWPDLDRALMQYQNPNEGDKVLKIQKDLDETKGILVSGGGGAAVADCAVQHHRFCAGARAEAG